MSFKTTFSQLNIPAQCQKYNVALWQCPSFLFFMMGIVIIISSLTAYAMGTRYIDSPETVALIVLIFTAILFIMSFIITQGFERLAEASRLKSEFVSVVSHQIRSPLTNLNWTLDLLMSGNLGKVEEKQAEYFKILKENSGRMGELVDDLLIVSRLETTKLLIKKEETSLSDITQELIKQFTVFSQASNVEIIFNPSSDVPKIFTDPSQVKVAIENLLDNAIRYTKGGGRITMTLSKKDNKIFFEIEDSGLGIPKEDQKFIFQKFFRSNNARKHQTQGSGLGLYISKSIVERLGGQIGLRSQEGKGSTFWFVLPIK
ncbi:MAG: HAMP domain-containing sensor histidine kinase [Patescibacteria group bacterium]